MSTKNNFPQSIQCDLKINMTSNVDACMLRKNLGGDNGFFKCPFLVKAPFPWLLVKCWLITPKNGQLEFHTKLNNQIGHVPFEKPKLVSLTESVGLQAGPASVSQNASNPLNWPNFRTVSLSLIPIRTQPRKIKYVCSYTLPYFFLWKLIFIYNNPTSTTLPKTNYCTLPGKASKTGHVSSPSPATPCWSSATRPLGVLKTGSCDLY